MLFGIDFTHTVLRYIDENFTILNHLVKPLFHMFYFPTAYISLVIFWDISRLILPFRTICNIYKTSIQSALSFLQCPWSYMRTLRRPLSSAPEDPRKLQLDWSIDFPGKWLVFAGLGILDIFRDSPVYRFFTGKIKFVHQINGWGFTHNWPSAVAWPVELT